jgi:hypothetical protein
MAEHHGRLDNEVANATMQPVVDIAAAYACPFRLDEHVVGRLEVGDRPIFKRDFVFGL